SCGEGAPGRGRGRERERLPEADGGGDAGRRVGVEWHTGLEPRALNIARARALRAGSGWPRAGGMAMLTFGMNLQANPPVSRGVIGKKPVSVETMEWACRLIRDLAAGREVDFEGTKLQLKWSLGHEVEIWVAAYGPKALRAAGRVADGLIMQLADPYIIEWSL